MYFQHSRQIWRDFPALVPGVLFADGVTKDASPDDRIAHLVSVAESRLSSGSEADLPEIQAWRRTFARMGLKPTQYRCASESLLRRFRRERSLPRIHPLIDVCNAVSLAYAIPIAAFDVAGIAGFVEVRHATGAETYETFSGEVEHPEPDEVVFADAAGLAHARRWTNRQSGRSAVQGSTTGVLIVAEALHGSAYEDIDRLTAEVTDALAEVWSITPASAILSAATPRFDFG